jgi:hypothetical protein
MNAYWGSGGTAPHILDLSTRWGVSGQPHTSAALSLGKESPVPIEQEAGWAAPEPVWTGW